jgi:autotransporter-associated beta strand protein
MGEADGAISTLNQSGGTINATLFQAADGNATAVSTINVSGGLLDIGTQAFFLCSRGTGTLTVSGTGQIVCGTLDVSRNASSAGSTGVVNPDGGTLTVNRVSAGTSATGSGGTPTATFNFNGGTLTAGASSSTWFLGHASSPAIPVNAFVKSGGAVIDTAGFNVSVMEPLQHDSALGGTPDGGLTKLGDGTLTLGKAGTYTGDTVVKGGTLEIALATLATNSTVSVTNGALLQLDFTETNQVAALVLDGVSQPAGIYNAATSPGFISGAGSLVVGAGPAPQLTITGFSVSGTTLNLSAMNGTANGQFILLGTTNVALPLSAWTPVLTNTFDNSGSLDLSTNIVDPNIPQQFYIIVE